MSQPATGRPYQRAAASPSCPSSTGKATGPGSLNRIRCRRGRALFRERHAEIWRVAHYDYRVPSQNDGGLYNVCLKPAAEHCSCPDFARHARRADLKSGEFYCKHLFAALMVFIKSAHVSVRTDDCSPKEAA